MLHECPNSVLRRHDDRRERTTFWVLTSGGPWRLKTHRAFLHKGQGRGCVGRNKHWAGR